MNAMQGRAALVGALLVGGAGVAAARFTKHRSIVGSSSSASELPRVDRPEKTSPAVSAESHRRGRVVLEEAWRKAFPGESPTRAALQIAGAVATLEGQYGRGCYKNKREGTQDCNTNNWGAIQGSKEDPATGKIGGFLASDYNAREDQWFERHYQRYASPADGAAHLLRLIGLYAHDAMIAGDVLRFSREMYVGAKNKGTLIAPRGYYGGINKPRSRSSADLLDASWANINDHSKRVFLEAHTIAEALGEPLEAFLLELAPARAALDAPMSAGVGGYHGGRVAPINRLLWRLSPRRAIVRAAKQLVPCYRNDPRWDWMMGGVTKAPDQWAYYWEDYGTTCGVVADAVLELAGAPERVLNRGKDFKVGDHIARLYREGKPWIVESPAELRAGDVYYSAGAAPEHVGIVLDVHGRRLTTADGGQRDDQRHQCARIVARELDNEGVLLRGGGRSPVRWVLRFGGI